MNQAGPTAGRRERLRRLNQAQQRLLEQQQTELQRLHAERADLLERLRSEQQRLRDWAGWLDGLEGSLREILSSTSWRVGKPIRLLRHLLRLDLAMLRATLAREPDPLASPQRPFAGSAAGNVEAVAPPRRALPWPGLVWPGAPKPPPHTYWRAPHHHPEGAWLGELVDPDADCDWATLAQTSGVASSEPVLVHIHLHAETAADWLRERCGELPAGCLIALSAPDARCLDLARSAIAPAPQPVHEQLAPGPLFALAKLLSIQANGQGLLLHLTTGPCAQPSGERDLAAAWRSLLGQRERVARIRALLSANPRIAVLATQSPARWPDWQQAWLNLRGLGEHWAAELAITALPSGRFSFPRPALFWARIPALARLTGIAGKAPPHADQASITLHEDALARLLPALTAADSQQCAYLVDSRHPGWSPHRVERTLLDGDGRLKRAIADRAVRTVAFDIFDTLVTRPLLDPERIKHLVARNHGGEAAEHYLRWRAEAEQRARAAAGRDVALDQVYQELGRAAPLDEADLERLRALEERLERHSCAARPQAQALINHAIALGKRVVLISDMFLPRVTVEALLADAGLRGWQALYLSSEVGVRKDSGLLYQHVLERESLLPGELLMIGDNEYADVALPAALGLKQAPVLRPVDLARALPRLAPLLTPRAQPDLCRELTLGTVVRGVFGALQIDGIEPESLLRGRPWEIGYGVLGPLLHHHAHWLSRRARADGIRRLYFLAREGEILKLAYERCTRGISDAPIGQYLLVSRRAVSVASIETFDDIRAIAATTCEPMPVGAFLEHRYGVVVDAAALPPEWPAERVVCVSDGDTRALEPLLRALEAPIRARAAEERPALLRYLGACGLDGRGDCAVVDIGYSASIQDHLNRLCAGNIHGYYLATTRRAADVAKRHGVKVVGGLAQDLTPEGAAHPLYHGSFHLEKLLSSDTTQVLHHCLTDHGTTAVFQPQHPDEHAARGLRHAIRTGALAYLDDAIATAQVLLPGHSPPADLVVDLYRALITDPSADEQAILSGLVLDDHYCGRGLVR